MGNLMKGSAAGSSESDPGAQGSMAGGQMPSEADVVSASERFTPGKPKSQGFQNVEGTSPTGETR